MFDLKKLIVLFVVSILCMGGAAQAASGSDGKGSEKHSSSDNKKSSSDKDHESSDDKDHESISGENQKASYDDKQDSWDGGGHLSLKDDDYTPSSSDNKDSWDGKVFGGHDFNPGLGQDGDHWNDFSTSSVPETETYAMLIAGLSLLGFLSRRKKKDI
jgi:hypothetical protein